MTKVIDAQGRTKISYPPISSGDITGFDEAAQDAVGNNFLDTATIDAVYTDATPSFSWNVIADSITNVFLADMAANTMKGNYTGSTDNPTDGALAANQFFARSSAGNISAKTITDFALTLVDDANAAAARTTLGIVQGSTNWIDVSVIGTYVAAPVTTGNPGATNVTNLHAIMAAAPSGSVLYFPGGFYPMVGTVTQPAKVFRWQGAQAGIDGNLTALIWTANAAGHLVTLTDNNWYTTFHDMGFLTSVTQTAGAAVHVGENRFTNFFRCVFGATAGQLNRCIDYTGTGGPTSASGAISVVDYCNFTSFNEIGIMCNANVQTIIIQNCTMNGANDTSTIGINVHIGGAVQIVNCDIIGCNNNLLIDPVVITVVASVFVVNSYFDNSQGSCIKITGAGATVRCKFIGCSFTTAETASPNIAFECSTTMNYGTLGQGLDIVSCNILNTFDATPPSGTGLDISGAADFYILNCNIAAWTTGINITSATTAAMCQPSIIGNQIGPCGGYPGNTTGIQLNVGSVAYGSVQIAQNILSGNTTNLVNNMGANAPVLPNEFFSGDNLGIGLNRYAARNTISQTVATSALAAVTGMFFPIVERSTNYQFDSEVFVSISTTGTQGIGVAINAPAGATLNAMAQGPTGNSTSPDRKTFFTAIAGTSQTGFMTLNGVTGPIRISGVIKAGTATSHTGSVQVQVRVATGSMTVSEGSWIVANKVT